MTPTPEGHSPDPTRLRRRSKMALITLALASALGAFTAAGAPGVQADADAAQPWQTMIAGG